MKAMKMTVAVALFSGILAVSSLAGHYKFGDLPLNTRFFFLTDTNHTYQWMKISASSGSNTVNRVVAPIKALTVVESEKITLYVCSMHTEVVQAKPGACPKCGMDLVQKP